MIKEVKNKSIPKQSGRNEVKKNQKKMPTWKKKRKEQFEKKFRKFKRAKLLCICKGTCIAAEN
jgi:hypothetical protein